MLDSDQLGLTQRRKGAEKQGARLAFVFHCASAPLREVLCLALVLIWGSGGLAAQDVVGGGSAAADELALLQSRVADKYAKLEQLLLKMSELESLTNPKRAQLLTRAVEQSKERLTKTQLDTLVKLLNQKQLKRAVDGQVVVQTDLKALLELLMSEDRSDRLKSEQQRIKEYIKEVERLIRLERSVQSQTEANAAAKRLADEQARIAAQTGDLARKIKENEEPAEQQPASAEDSGQKKPDEGKTEESSKDDGKKSDAQEGKQEGEKGGKGQKGQKGEKGDQQKSKADKKGKSNAGGQKPDGQKSDGQKSESQKSDGKNQDGQAQDGEQSKQNQQGQDGQQGQQGQQSKQQQQQQDEQAQQQNPARQGLEKAQQKMQEAQKKLEEAKHKESLEDQRAARAELEKAKAELEEILRQLREEEVARTLAQLEARFRKMLEMQLAVLESTRKLEQLPAERRGEAFLVQTGKLSADERKIAIEAQKALSLLQEEGSSIAFPATVEQMHSDMEQVTARLGDAKADGITVGIEEDIVAALEELIAALQQAQRDKEEQQKQQQEQQQQQPDGEEPLVDQIAELKMIKSLQERVNKRTQRYAKLLADESDPIGQAAAPDLAAAVRQLGDRQLEIFRITRDIVLGKNQ